MTFGITIQEDDESLSFDNQTYVDEQIKKRVVLYDWQRRAMEYFFENNKVVYECSTGTGKTQLAIEIVKKIWETKPDLRVLVVVPKNVILETGWYKELYDNGFMIKDIGLFYSSIKEISRITLTNIQNVSNIPLEMFDVLVADECVTGNTKIRYYRATRKNGQLKCSSDCIKNIVEKKKHLKILSYDFDKKETVVNKINKWFKSETPRDIYDVELENGTILTTTEDHKFYTDNGWKKLKEMNVGNNVFVVEKSKRKGDNKSIIKDDDIKQVILNSFIADGHVTVHPSNTSARCVYSSINKNYIELKKNILERYGEKVNCKLKDNSKGYNKNGKIYVMQTKSYYDILKMYEQYKEEGIDFILDNLNDLGIVLWMFDDGSACRGINFRLHCNRFKEHDIDKIVKYFNNRGISCRKAVNNKKDGRVFYYVHFYKKGLRKLIDIMRKYCCKGMGYKIKWS